MQLVRFRRSQRYDVPRGAIDAALADFQRRTGVDYLEWLHGNPTAEKRLDRLNLRAMLGESREQQTEEEDFLRLQDRAARELRQEE